MKRKTSKKIIVEHNWNFHHMFNSDNEIDINEPYHSENRYVGYHSNGVFGSGTYFSTYTDPHCYYDDMEKYGDNYNDKDPYLKKVEDKIYRIDFDLYKNLYKIATKDQGDALYEMMYNLNKMFSNISGCRNGHYKPENSLFSNKKLYLKIKDNAHSLSLKCPSYLGLIRLMQKHAQSDNKQTFATLFMEKNGYNGVDVSGIEYYDTYEQGSVIYNLNKYL